MRAGSVALLGLLILCCWSLCSCDNAGSPCTPGAARPCACPGGGKGVQRCPAEATWGSCTGCGQPDSGATDVLRPPDTAPPVADAGRDLPLAKREAATGDAKRDQPALKPDQPALKPDQPPLQPDKPPPVCPTNALFYGIINKGSSTTATSGPTWLTIKLVDVDINKTAVLTDWTNSTGTSPNNIMNLSQTYTDSGTGFHVKVTEIWLSPAWARFCIWPP